jgi:hypothetical protein
VPRAMCFRFRMTVAGKSNDRASLEA